MYGQINTTKLKALRKLKRFTQEELAKRAKMSKTYYSDIETGRVTGSIKVIARIAKALDTSIDELIKGDEEGGER